MSPEEYEKQGPRYDKFGLEIRETISVNPYGTDVVRRAEEERRGAEAARAAMAVDKAYRASPILPVSSLARKDAPIARGLLDYFPRACAAVAALSKIGNEKHNPGEPMHWAREKSNDHADCIVRHLMERGTIDPDDGVLHDTKVAWRALAMLELALERGSH